LTKRGRSTPSPRKRADLLLVERGLFESRARAQAAIEAGLVLADDKRVLKPSETIAVDAVLQAQPAHPFVSRGGVKLTGALEQYPIEIEGHVCLDVGASTGGFTQVLLRHGADHVIALDVGHGQLVPEVAEDPRVTERSGVNVRGVQPADLGGPADLVVADLSFISLQVVLGVLATLTTPDGDLVVLVKPQFEVGRDRLGHGGVVRSPGERARAIVEVATVAEASGLHPLDVRASPLRGTTGNVEYLLWLTPRAGEGLAPDQVAALAAELSAEGTA
jgi:23S rRNA (cytidine1920-2'-O)/16S rRNA (cytidine1409-2'-O)-methyltransferase